MSHRITSTAQLREHYEDPIERALRKQIDHLDEHCRGFISRSPFALLSTSSSDGTCDVTPRGGTPGFCRVTDDGRLVMPDVKGNRRLDSLSNIAENPHAGLLFLIPGLDQTLRVNGGAWLSTDPELVGFVSDDGKPAILAVVVEPAEVFVHCAKALIRSSLWDSESWLPREELPSAALMMRDHMGSDQTVEEVQAQSDESIATRLY